LKLFLLNLGNYQIKGKFGKVLIREILIRKRKHSIEIIHGGIIFEKF
jgi:hypothetical protein